MTAQSILSQLKDLGQDSIKKTLMRHGIKEPLYGVKIEDMKKTIVKHVKANHQLALELYATGVYDAMYLAGLIAEPEKMSVAELQLWAQQANAPILRESTVAWVASESKHGMQLALDWIRSADEDTACIGWATLSSIVAIKEDSELDMPLLKQLLSQVKKVIHNSPNRVKSTMNIFVIAVGCYVKELSNFAIKTAEDIEAVTVDMGDTACKVPFAVTYIEKVAARNTIGKKRKSARC